MLNRIASNVSEIVYKLTSAVSCIQRRRSSRLSAMTSPMGVSPSGKRQKQLERQDVSMASTSAMNGSPQRSTKLVEENGFEKVLTKEEKRKDKKRKREEKIKVAQRPQFMFNTDGFKHHKRIGVAHIRDLVLHIVTEHTAPNWILVQHRSNIAHTVVVLAPGIQMMDLGLDDSALTPASYLPFSIASTSSSSPSKIPIMSKIFSVACPTRAPGDSRRLFSVVQTLLQTPLSQAEQKKKEKQKERMVAARSEDLGDPTIYLLTPSQMVDNEYPMPDYMPLRGDEPYLPGRKMRQSDQDRELDALARQSKIPRRGQGVGWRETPKAESASQKYNVLAIDCEMCLTEDGQELTRATVIDYESGKVLFDELCMPKKPVLDYLTRWSGITAEKLQHATLALEDIQARLLDGPDALLTPHTILLGHSLESDLCALKIRHPLCIDTALLYKHARGPPYKPALKWLCSQWLGRQIQTAGEGGHDSEEDARACLDLLRMKVAQGPNFGEVGSETESIFERMARHAQSSTKPGRSAAICDYGNPSQWHGQRAKTAVRCISDDDVSLSARHGSKSQGADAIAGGQGSDRERPDARLFVWSLHGHLCSTRM